MSDSQARSRLRSSEASGSPEEQARVLVDRMRAAPMCEACGGTGRTAEPRAGSAASAKIRAREHIMRALAARSIAIPSDASWDSFHDDRRRIYTERLTFELNGQPYGMEHSVGEHEARSIRLEASCPPCAGTGSPFRARVELAAYCNSDAAILALGFRPCPDNMPTASIPEAARFSAWVSGLSRWGQDVQVRAAVAAAQPAMDAWVAGLPGEASAAFVVDHLHMTRAAIEAAKAWLECPCAAHGDAWSLLFSPWFDMWVPVSVMAIERSTPLDHGHTTPAHGIRRAAEVAGESAVRSAIQSALIAYALGDS